MVRMVLEDLDAAGDSALKLDVLAIRTASDFWREFGFALNPPSSPLSVYMKVNEDVSV